MTAKTKIFAGLIILAFVSRIVPHYPNFTAMGALAFYGAFSMKRLALTITAVVATMMASDLIINNLIYPTDTFVFMYVGSVYTYLGFAAYSLIGHFSNGSAKAGLGLVAGSLVFFAVSNFGVWASVTSLYSENAAGLLATYIAAIPFYAPELLSTGLFSAVAYGAHRWVTKLAKA